MKVIFKIIITMSICGLLSAADPKQIEQQYGGEWCVFPEINSYVAGLADNYGIECKILNHSEPKYWVYSSSEVAITRGFLSGCHSEGDLLEIFKQANDRTVAPRCSSSERFEQHIALLRNYDRAYQISREAMIALREGRYEEALNLAEEAEEIIPDDPLIISVVGRAKDRCGNTPGALIEYKKALRLNDHYYDFYLQRALILMRVNVNGVARNDALESLSLLPTDEGHYVLGTLDLRAGEYNRARDHLSHIQKPNQNMLLTMVKAGLMPSESF